MRVQFIKNIHFTRLLKINGRLREFNFRKLKAPQEELFSVDVSDERGNRIMFQMQKDSNTWKITDQKVPKWILENEDKMNEVIEEELRNV
ncbi:MAG TPA: hypothetical protein VN958_17790 [Chitinophagaceae bacterium]|nr:hypothetical protein [Chitinophagaceae bacterium]